MSTQNLFSVRDVAQRLGLHERTVRNYLRSGALRGTRIGKQYRISRDDLEAFAGPDPGLESASNRPRAEVSSIIELEPVSPELQARLETLVISLPSEPGAVPLRVQTLTYPERNRIKIIATGELGVITRFLEVVERNLS